jgi:ABC-type lipoprotein release transport system permease subunit
MVFGVSPTDPRMMVAVALALIAIAAVACLGPGLRASKLDPALILRE